MRKKYFNMKTTERPKNNFDTTVFNELNFLSHPMGMGEQCIVQFPNGYGASIVKGEHTYGGKNGWNSANYLNIWVCNIGGGILGYAQFPGGAASTDGVVLGGEYFGVTGGVYGAGRTATHEVGHYFNLRHIWGDGRCRQDDFVADTPSSDSSNGGCPTFPSVSCKTADMTMNYMDYTYDNCMYMFTDGQRNRMRALFAPGGARFLMSGS